MSMTCTVASTLYIILDASMALVDQIDRRSTLTLKLHDPTGLNHIADFSQINIHDSVFGDLYNGYVQTADEDNLYPNPDNYITVACYDNHYLADKRFYNGPEFINQYAGNIAIALIKNYLAAEGVTVEYALREDTTASDFNAGTLSGVIGTSNVGDGDLELATAGTTLSYTDNLSSGTLTNTQVVGGALQLASTHGLMLTGTAVQNSTNPYVYIRIWDGSSSISSGDALQYDVWISSTSPAQEAGVDGICSDGSTIRDFSPTLTDQNGIHAHPSADLSGFATDQWYTRTIDLTPMAGKTLSTITVALEGNNNGTYTAYFRHIKQVNGGSTVQTFYNTTLQENAINSSDSYTNIALTQTTVYEMSGSRLASAISMNGVKIVKNSLISFTAPAVTTTALVNGVMTTIPDTASTLPTVVVQTSIDNGATWQSCTSGAVIPNLIAGMKVTSRNLLLQQVFTMAGTDPTVTPTITACSLTVQTSYNATTTDVVQTEQTQSDWNAGSLTHLHANSDNTLTLNESSRDWHKVSDLSDQTLYGVTAGNPGQTTQNGNLQLFCNNGGASNDARSRQDYAGTWNNFTAETDINLGSPVVALAYGIEYRTTVWSNNLNSFGWYAYFIFTSTGGAGTLNLGYGTNSSGGGVITLVPTPVPVTLSSGSTHRMRVVVSGSNHKVYLDDVLYINVTDSTYSGNSGYIALHFFNNSAGAGAHSGDFSNFGVCASLTGTYQTVSQSLSAAGHVGNSLIAWDETADSTGLTSLAVTTSINGGSTWQTATNGGAITGLTAGLSLSGISLLVQIVFTSPNANLTPILVGLTAWVIGQFSASGNRISPVLSLSPVGSQAGSTFVGWNVNTPPNTTFGIDVSPDGSTWTDVTSVNPNTIPGIVTQSDPTIDQFAVDDHANYTSTNATGGSTSTWTFNTSLSQLSASGGVDAEYLYTGLTASDVDLLCHMSESNGGGLVWRRVNANNCYILSITDNLTPLTPNNAYLYKVSGGTKMLLTSVGSIGFTRTTYHSFHLQMIGGVITVFMDGNQILTYTDGSPLGSGGVGLYNTTTSTGSISFFYQFRAQPLGQSLSGLNAYTRLRLASTDPTATPQVLDVTLSARSPAISTGGLLPATSYSLQSGSSNTIAQCLDDCAKNSNDIWWGIDKAKKFRFQNRKLIAAPFILQDGLGTNMQWSTPPKVSYASPLYRNRHFVQGGIDTTLQHQTFIADGITQSWNLDYQVNAMVSAPSLLLASPSPITVGGVPKTIGISGIDTGKDFYYSVGSKTITQDSGEAPFGYPLPIDIWYQGQVPVLAMAESTSQQAIIAALDGTTGIIEQTESISGLTFAQAQAVADARIAQYAVLAINLTATTLVHGLAPGQFASVFYSAAGIMNIAFLITKVTTRAYTAATATGILPYYDIEMTSGPHLPDWTHLFVAG